MQNYDWTSQATHIEDVELQTYFSSMANYYFGDLNSRNQEDYSDPKLHLTLPVLSFNSEKSDWTNASEIAGNEIEFGNYYKFLIEKAYEYGHSYNTIRQYFWMRSSFVSESSKLAVGFPWYDNSSEFSAIYKWIVNGNDGDVFSDIEQGWQLNGIIRDQKVFFLESDDSYPIDMETSEIYNIVSFDIERLKSLVDRNKKIVQGIIKNLTREIGIDVWTTYHYEENLKFGTVNWKPKTPSAAKAFLGKLFRK